MTEAEWLAASDPYSLSKHLSSLETSNHARKAKLLVAAAGRILWDLLTDDRSRFAIEAAERYYDGLIDLGTFRQATQQAHAAVYDKRNTRKHWYRSAADVAYMLHNTYTEQFPIGIGVGIVNTANKIKHLIDPEATVAEVDCPLTCHIVRCIFGNPFRPVAVDPSWRTEAVVALAEGIYQDRAFERMPVLADSLEDAGCANEDILSHCRGDVPHVRGCWVLDLLLGKK